MQTKSMITNNATGRDFICKNDNLIIATNIKQNKKVIFILSVLPIANIRFSHHFLKVKVNKHAPMISSRLFSPES